jgi:signal peptidase II
VRVIGLLVSGGTVLLVDQWSKSAVRVLGPDGCISYGHFLRIHRVANLNRIYRSVNIRRTMALVWLLALASAVVLHNSGSWFQGPAALIGLGLALGGAAGNLLDIWRHQFVVDFIDLGWWPVFNFADVSIVGGLLLAFWR